SAETWLATHVCVHRQLCENDQAVSCSRARGPPAANSTKTPFNKPIVPKLIRRPRLEHAEYRQPLAIESFTWPTEWREADSTRMQNVNVEHYQNLVIGSGEAGKMLAWSLARMGPKTVVIERSMIGGSCPNVACLPSKNVMYSAKAVLLVDSK